MGILLPETITTKNEQAIKTRIFQTLEKKEQVTVILEIKEEKEVILIIAPDLLPQYSFHAVF